MKIGMRYRGISKSIKHTALAIILAILATTNYSRVWLANVMDQTKPIILRFEENGSDRIIVENCKDWYRNLFVRYEINDNVQPEQGSEIYLHDCDVNVMFDNGFAYNYYMASLSGWDLKHGNYLLLQPHEFYEATTGFSKATIECLYKGKSVSNIITVSFANESSSGYKPLLYKTKSFINNSSTSSDTDPRLETNLSNGLLSILSSEASVHDTLTILDNTGKVLSRMNTTDMRTIAGSDIGNDAVACPVSENFFAFGSQYQSKETGRWVNKLGLWSINPLLPVFVKETEHFDYLSYDNDKKIIIAYETFKPVFQCDMSGSITEPKGKYRWKAYPTPRDVDKGIVLELSENNEILWKREYLGFFNMRTGNCTVTKLFVTIDESRKIAIVSSGPGGCSRNYSWIEQIEAFSLLDGKLLWEKSMYRLDCYPPETTKDGLLVENDEYLCLLDIETGNRVWSTFYTTESVSDRDLASLGGNGRLVRLYRDGIKSGLVYMVLP